MVQLGALTEELTTTLESPTSTTTTSTRNIQLITTKSTTKKTTKKSTLGEAQFWKKNQYTLFNICFELIGSVFSSYIDYFIYNWPLASGIFFGRKSTKLVKTTTTTTTTSTTTLETPSTSPQVGLLDGIGEILLNNPILKEGGKVFQGFMSLLGR